VIFTEKNIFLFDGTGALFSAIFTGIILPLFSDLIGLPLWILYCLALFPITYGFYSFSCYYLMKKSKAWMLLTIILANIFYCFVSGVLIFKVDSITLWGQLLLAAEILVILVVVSIEMMVYQRTYKNIE
jgi:hypothetical protein